MSTIVSGITSRPSRIHNLVYVIFGYVVASAVVPTTQVENLSDYLLLVSLVGGFIGTFLFYIKPVESILSLVASRREYISQTVLTSPFLIETKGKIISGIYFFMLCHITVWNPNLSNLIWENLLLPAFLITISLIVLYVSRREVSLLYLRVFSVEYYYRLVSRKPDHMTEAKRNLVLGQLKAALERGDWIESWRIFMGTSKPEKASTLSK